MNEFKILANEYLNRSTRAFYHVPYVKMGSPGNPDYLNTIKNTFNSFSERKLESASQELKNVLLRGFPQVIQFLNTRKLTVCVVPRAKAENSYHANQLLFKSAVCSMIKQFESLEDGADYLCRHTSTRTTHLRRLIQSYSNDGVDPYPGITEDTCSISADVEGKHILLIDDIYTQTVNIDEDAIQSLINAGACSVAFYAVAKTQRNYAL